MTLEKQRFLSINLGKVKGYIQTIWNQSFYRDKDYSHVENT